MSIEVGDAVLKFLGDSTNLDVQLDAVPGKTKAAFDDAAESVEDAGQRMQGSMSEARGEVRLLGEEFGVRLPRHVGNFLASLPGVGPAMSAAFSATAVLFLAQALVQLSEKGSKFIADTLIYTQAAKDSNQATIDTNKLLLEQSAAYQKATDEKQKFGAVGSDALRLQLKDMQAQLHAAQAQVALGPQTITQAQQQTHEYITQHGWVSKIVDLGKAWFNGSKTQITTLREATVAAQEKYLDDASNVKTLQAQLDLLNERLETEHKLEGIRQGGATQASAAKLKAAQQEAEVALDSQTAEKRKQIAEQLEDSLYTIKRDGMLKQLAILKENDANTKDAQQKLLSELRVAADEQAKVVADRLKAEKDELLKTLDDMAKGIKAMPEALQIIPPAAVTNLLNGINAAKQLSITLRQDLVKAYEDAKKAEVEFQNSGIQDPVAAKAFGQAVDNAKRKLQEFGKAEIDLSEKNQTTWKGLIADLHEGADATQAFTKFGQAAFNGLSKDIEGAFQSIVLGQGKVGEELKKATASQLASIAAQAAVKALFYTAEGFASLAGFNAGSAADYFTAAGEMAAVAVAAGAAGRGLAGGSGSSSSGTQAGHNTLSNTSSQAGGTQNISGVQMMATGGLVPSPTLAMLAEAGGPEAVIPLTDPNALKAIGEAIGNNGGGGGHSINFHIEGLVSADHLSKLVKRINNDVNAGRLYLRASDSLRVTKRSA